MDPSEQGTTSKGSNDHDPRLDLLKQKYSQLSGQIQSLNSQYVSTEDMTLNVFKLIDGTYFYESLAQFGFNFRLNHFYSCLKVGDRFVAKVVGVFERCADVVLVWSPRRDICDLKIKAYLRLVEQKRYNNGNRYGKYPRLNNSVIIDKNLEISELIFVELVQFNKGDRKIEVIRCKALANDDTPDDDNDEDDGLLNEEKYKSKSPSQLSFHDYMLDHNHLRNPSLIKQPTFTSLLYEDKVIDAYKRKLKEKSAQLNKANLSIQNDDDVILLDDRKLYKQNSTMDGAIENSKRKIEFVQSTTTKLTIKNSEFNHLNSKETKTDNLKRNHSVSSDFTPNSLNDSSRRSKYSSSFSSSSSSSDSDSESDSTSSSDEYRKRHKRKYKRSKSSHERRQHKKKSKKHSKKSKKKKSKKSKDHRHRRDSSPYKKKKIDNKILELLKFT